MRLAAAKDWRRLDGRNLLPKVILGVKFADGIEIKSHRKLKPAATSSPGPPNP
jgi:hypothetical protein